MHRGSVAKYTAYKYLHNAVMTSHFYELWNHGNRFKTSDDGGLETAEITSS